MQNFEPMPAPAKEKPSKDLREKGHRLGDTYRLKEATLGFEPGSRFQLMDWYDHIFGWFSRVGEDGLVLGAPYVMLYRLMEPEEELKAESPIEEEQDIPKVIGHLYEVVKVAPEALIKKGDILQLMKDKGSYGLFKAIRTKSKEVCRGPIAFSYWRLRFAGYKAVPEERPPQKKDIINHPHFDMLRRDGIPRSEAIALTQGALKGYLPNREPKEREKPLGHLRRLFRLPTPGMSKYPGKED